MSRHTLKVAVALLATAALLAGCGTSSPAHNPADVAFATDMIPHHAQAVSMSKLATEHADSPKVKDLARRIEGAQQPEIDQMSGWLRAWNAPVPSTEDPAMGAMPGMDHQTHPGMPGMMSADQMRQLEQAHGAAFDALFLRMMVGHHEGAITMATAELSGGQNGEAKTLAQQIITAQRGEITEMNSMLAQG